MRILWKLSVMLLISGAVQCGLARSANEIDEAAFVLHLFCATSRGVPLDDPEMQEEATRLLRRQCWRNGGTLPSDDERGQFLVASMSDF